MSEVRSSAGFTPSPGGSEPAAAKPAQSGDGFIETAYETDPQAIALLTKKPGQQLARAPGLNYPVGAIVQEDP